jgi:ectoine hydroxylase-related dioxygenase (phytanoyl-CoA dioxygenase family)
MTTPSRTHPTATGPTTTGPTATDWFTVDDLRLEDFRAVVEQPTDPADYPNADSLEHGVLIYGTRLRDQVRTPEGRREVQAELIRAFTDGPGIAVFAGAFADTNVVDRATEVFTAIIDEQHASGATAGDHFAKPGANDRIWGALDKFAVREPVRFADYYANPVIALVSEAWLGPDYQITSQVNVVNPGGTAQVAHRDYHLGFMSAEQSRRYPAHVHRLSPTLTLQGAVAHCDMPIETGPTLYLPRSQQYGPGYLGFHQPEFTAYFDAHYVQLPLLKGDAVFFNPAVFHGAGTNRSADVRRMANLLQISSAFGRAMESVDRVAMCEALYPVLRARLRSGGGAGANDAGADAAVSNVVAAAAEGYAFPTNLDHDQPVDGLAPPTQADLLRQALIEGWDDVTFGQALHAQAARRR